MSQIELLIEFAFTWEIYLILYVGIGMVSAFMILIMLIYHYIFTRSRPRPKLIFYDFIKEGYPSIIIGFSIALAPMLVVELLNEIIMAGYVLTKNVRFNKNCVDTDTTDSCVHTIFDYMKLTGFN